MPIIPALTNYTDGTILPASSLNSDYGTIRTYVNSYALFKDVAGTVTVGHTFTATQTFTPGSGFGIDVTTGGARIQAGGLTVSAGGVTAAGQTLAALTATMTEGSVDARLRAVSASSAGQVGTFSNHPFWVVTNGSQRWEFQAAGHIVPLADNVYDIGTGSGPLRPRDLTLSRNAVIGGTLSVSGAATLSGGITGATAISGALTVSSGGAAITGNSTVTGTFGVSGSTFVGSASDLLTNATDGFLYIPRINGDPVGTPTTQGNRVAMCFSYSDNKLWIYDNVATTGWRSVALT